MTITGERRSLNSRDKEIALNSLLSFLNCNCMPIENKAKGVTVADSLEKKSCDHSVDSISFSINATKQAIKGGKDNTFLTINLNWEAAVPTDDLLPVANIIPQEDRIKNVTWSLIIPIFRYSFPKKLIIRGKPINDVLLRPDTIVNVTIVRLEKPYNRCNTPKNKYEHPNMKTGNKAVTT